MTAVTRPVRRSIENVDRGKDAVLTVWPGGAISVRLKRHKKEFFTNVRAIYEMAVIRTLAQEKAEKRAAKGLGPVKRLVRRGRVAVVLFALLSAAACHDSDGEALGGLPTSPTPAVATCPVVPLTIVDKAQDGSGPYLTLTLGQAYNEVVLLRNGTRVVEGVTTITHVQVEFSTTYQVQGRVGACWSLPVDVAIQDPNVDASDVGGRSVPGVPSPVKVCTSMVFTPGTPPVRLAIVAPRGVKIITMDDAHGPNYQPEQRSEQLLVDGERADTGAVIRLGTTPDIEQLRREASISYQTRWPIRAVILTHEGTGPYNSVHGACVEAL